MAIIAPLPFVFQPNTSAASSQVNANFAQIVANVNANAAPLPAPLGVPTGSLFMFAAVSVPTGYLYCNGQAVSRTTFAALFAIVSTTFGVGDGSTTFNLPDYRGYFPRGFDDGVGVDPGRAFGTVQQDQFQTHTHTTITTTTVNVQGGAAPVAEGALGGVTGPPTGNTGAETRPKNLSIIFIIKT
jgi:microcystin-dependent protein